MLWDIFCKVIDNHGDIGVCWRLAVQLAGRGQSVRLWIDDSSALAWMAPRGAPGVEVKAWDLCSNAEVTPGDVVIESFGCELDPSFRQALAALAVPPVWINLEYLTAEPFAQRNHGLPSPVLAGAGAGLVKHFFYPGFHRATGGLLRETDLVDLQSRHDADRWLKSAGAVPRPEARRVSLFCYEPELLKALLSQLAVDAIATQLLVTSGRANAATRDAVEALDGARPGWNAHANLSFTFLPLLTQTDYDRLLWSCDLNFVRGEDSIVRALWAGKPFIWHIYQQEDGAHRAKLAALLDWLDAPQTLRQFHLAWNGAGGVLPPIDEAVWGSCATSARARLLADQDLVTQLLAFVDKLK